MMSHDRLLEALHSLNHIGATINRIGPDVSTSVNDTLRLIVEGASKVVPGTSAVIYTYDQDTDRFDPDSCVFVGAPDDIMRLDEPRPNGLGRKAIAARHPILSYEQHDIALHPPRLAEGSWSAACYPLIVADQVVGVLYVYLHEARAFNELELGMLANFVNQAAMAIFHARRVSSVQRDLLRKEEELARLHRAGLLISSRPRLQDTLRAILQMALEMTSARYGIFRLANKAGDLLVTAAFAGEDLSAPLLEDLPLDSPAITTWVAQHRRPLLVPDLRLAPWSEIYYPLDSQFEMRSELAVPLIGASGRLEGVLNLESPEVSAFSQADSYLLQGLATQAVVAIQEVRLLDALQEMADVLLTRPYHHVLDHLVALARDLLNAADSAIWVLEGETLRLQAASADHGHDERIPLHGSLIGSSVLQRRPVTSLNLQADPAFYRPDLAARHGWDRALIVPLRVSDEPEPIGAFSVYSRTVAGRAAESEWDAKILVTLAHYAALAMQNEQRQRALRAAQDQRTLAETFAALGDIAANVLHQLNNKVGSIPVRVQGIEDKCAGILQTEPYLAANLGEIEKSASDAMNSVRESLSLLHPMRLAPVAIATCVAEAAASAKLPPAVRLETHNLDALPPVMVGRQGLTMVFANLFENAVRAMEGAGQITVIGEINHEWISVLVSDSGPGIPAEMQGRVFDFAPGREGAAPAGNLGFGLWWVKTLMARLGGMVE
ncbi:MAG: GAF domain-containing protein, partial [Anaerolineae bacterium]|nr:GAF domain-containing protein [Anaerolineae bacterium]